VPDEPPAEWIEQWLRERQQRERDAELVWRDDMRAAVHRCYCERRDSGVPDADEGLEQV
jgi:hypothetical protein